MKILMKIHSLIIILIITTEIICILSVNTFATCSLNATDRQIINIGVVLFNLADPFVFNLKEELENIEKENEGRVKFTILDGKNNVSIQNEAIDSILINNIDLLMVWFVEPKDNIIEDTINKVKRKNIPLVVIGTYTHSIEKFLRTYNKLAFITTDAKQAGTSQGEILADLWIKNKHSIDKNNDNILQYIMIKGKIDDTNTIERSEYSMLAIKNAGIKTELLEEVNADWLKDLSERSVYNLFLKYDGRIEAIIVNNDAMAIGAVEALQNFGYNKGNKSKFIYVFGIDGMPQAKALIDKGFMTGTVIHDPKDVARGAYKVGMNFINNLSPIANTDYKIENGVVLVTMPFTKYTKLD